MLKKALRAVVFSARATTAQLYPGRDTFEFDQGHVKVLIYNNHCYSTVVRLNGAGAPGSGRVEVYYKGVWGTVCDDSWDIDDAHVVCRMLGFPKALHAHSNAKYGQGTGLIWLDNVQCNGNEASIAKCPRKEWGDEDCSHSEDAGVVCLMTG